MQDNPHAAELAQAILEFLKNELAPVLQDQRLKFRHLVATNALGVLVRELQTEEPMLREEFTSMTEFLGRPVEAPQNFVQLKEQIRELSRELAAQIRQDQLGLELLPLLKKIVVNKVKIANPRYLESDSV